MGRKKRGGFLFRWMKSDLPDREEKHNPVLLLAVHKNSTTLQDNIEPDCYSLKNEDLDVQTEHQKHIFSQLNERFKKTLSLDSRTNRLNRNVLYNDIRPKSMVNSANYTLNNCSTNIPNINKPNKNTKKNRFRPKSFFSFETFLDSKRSVNSSVDDFSSSKYCKFYLDSSAECSPVLKGRPTPDLLDIPVLSEKTSGLSDNIHCKRRLDKLENHFNKLRKFKNSHLQPICKEDFNLNIEEPVYSEPVNEGSIDSQSTLTIEQKTNEEIIENCNSQFENVINNNCSRESDYFIKDNEVEKCSFNNKAIICNKKNYCIEVNYPNYKIDCVNKSHESTNQNFKNFGIREYSKGLTNGCYTTCSNSFGKIKSGGICCKEGTPSSAYEISVVRDDNLINEKTKNLVVKTMDKSVDSIGSCSLDVDAENTDFSDTTSGSLNILTPSSTGSHFKDFTLKFHERVTPGIQQDLRNFPVREENFNKTTNQEQPKKPSYLQLACSVNGYSNLTTYDSTLRQKLSKSREQSPARFGNICSYMLQNHPNETMAQNVNSSNSVINPNNFFKTSFSETSISSQNIVTYLKSNGQTTTETHTSKSYHIISNGAADQSPSKSFIQQRVERLYGPGALAQGFFNQKKQFSNESQKLANRIKTDSSSNCISKSENVVIKNSHNGVTSQNVYLSEDDPESVLPVLRHLRAEFRAQLPIISPKRSPLSKISDIANHNILNIETHISRLSGDEVDRGVTQNGCDNVLFEKTEERKPVVTIIPINLSTNGDPPMKTGISSDNDNNNETICIKEKSNVTHIVEDKEWCESKPVIESKNCITNVLSEPKNFPSTTSIEILNSTNESIRENDAYKISIQNEDLNNVENGQYFLNLCRTEIKKLDNLATIAENYLEELQKLPDVNEEAKGFLRVAAGKARLLAAEKMKQFEGLCFKNLNSQPDNKFPTTVDDLRGFWDMVYLQIEDIRILFEKIEAMKKSNWKEIPSIRRTVEASVKLSQAPVTKKTQKNTSEIASKSSALSKKRDEQRKALIEAKRRAAKLNLNSTVEIFTNPPPETDQNKEDS